MPSTLDEPTQILPVAERPNWNRMQFDLVQRDVRARLAQSLADLDALSHDIDSPELLDEIAHCQEQVRSALRAVLGTQPVADDQRMAA